MATTARTVEYETATRKYTHIDCPGHPDYVKSVIMGATNMDAAIVVVSARDGIMQQTREHMLLCKQLGVPYIIIFLSMIDLVDEGAVLDLCEMELKHYMATVGYDVKSTFIIRGSALGALKGTEEEPIRKLLEVMDSKIGQTSSPLQEPLKLPIDHVFGLPASLHQRLVRSLPTSRHRETC